MKLSIRQIRKMLFDSNKYAVIGAYEMTNKEARDFLYNIEDQDMTFNVIEENTHFLIY